MTFKRLLVRGILEALALGVVLNGCVKRAAAPNAPIRDSVSTYYPLAVGNLWTYEANFLGQRRVQEVKILKEERGYFIDSQGGELTVDALGIRDRQRYLLREPIEVGTRWTNVLSVASVEHYQLSKVGPCEVPAGRFEGCVQVEGRNRVDDATTLINQLTFAPRTGIVRIEVSAEVKGRRIPQTQLLLTKFQAGQ